MRMILIVLAALSIQQVSHAETAQTGTLAGIQAALDARNEFVTALQNKDFTSITHDVMDAVIRDFANQLSPTDAAAAQDIINWWEQQASANFAAQIATRVTARDLGDHPPLFPWLADEMNALSSKYPEVAAIQIFKDIWTLNYAIPVVFTPHGSWELVAGQDNRIEYRLHFIPFSDIVTYYTSLYGCKYALAHYGLSDLKKICPKAAAELEKVNGRYIAPQVSDWIYKEANGTAASGAIVITDGQLYYNSASSLQAAIQ